MTGSVCCEKKMAKLCPKYALRFASGRYTQFLDADDILDPRKIEEQYLYLNARGNDGISTSRWGYAPAADWQDPDPVEFAILKYGGGGMMPPNTWLILEF
jgi:Glycosyl transferase family 2